MAKSDTRNMEPLLIDERLGRAGQGTFSDTDPQMLHAIWMMEAGYDPDRSLDEVKDAVVVYDKFAPRLSKRRL